MNNIANHISNYPNNQVSNLPSEQCSELVSCLMELGEKGKPTSLNELKERCKAYFRFCGENGFRCGIENLAVALGVTRQTFYNWCNGNGCTKEWQDECLKARQLIVAFSEQLLLSGKISPPSGIFIMKNIAGWKDQISFEDATDSKGNFVRQASELPTIEDISNFRKRILPRLDGADDEEPYQSSYPCLDSDSDGELPEI